jgi:hypothetical protein
MSSNETIKQAVMAGMGIALLSRHTIGLELQTGRLAELDVAGLPLMRRWYVVRRAGRFESAASTAFVDFVVASAPGVLRELLSQRRAAAAGSAGSHASRRPARPVANPGAGRQSKLRRK